MDSADEDAVIRIRREGEDQYDPMVLVWNSEAVITDATVAVAILVFVLIAGESLARFIFSPAKAAQKTVGRRMETFVTSARASRPCLQFHLSTLVLVSFVAGTLLLVNMEAREARYIVNGSLHNGEVEHYWGYGWPFLFRMKLIAVSTETRRYAVNSREYEFDKVFCFGSVLVNLLILAGAAVALEMARVSGTRTKLTDAGKPGHTSLAEPAKSGDTIHDGEEKKP
ncbi:MAG: hypothetical protein NTW87_07490 [Planctomycetota bacterium]|nr:hypothetical protein [Planctomycetota bacterium]